MYIFERVILKKDVSKIEPRKVKLSQNPVNDQKQF